MPLKFQFQFAGADFSRPSSPYRKWLRIGLMVVGALVVALAYWQYLHHLTHTRRPMTSPAAPAVVAPAAHTAPAPIPTLKKIADNSLVAVGTYLIRAAEATPVATAVPAAPVAEPAQVTTAAAAPVAVVISDAPTTARPYKVHTDQERLVMAGETAFDNVMDLANKYPDAYGFEAGDFLSDAKLGEPMAVYTIDESDRANYKAGQPVKPLLKLAKQWVFPVMMGDRICCMVDVEESGHEYIPGKGNKSLAMAWNKILERWPAEAGYHPLLVVNPDVPGYYFTVPELSQQNITDIIEMFYFHPGISPADVILASWR